MNDERDQNDPEFEDPEEQQRFENDLLKLKLQAEHGAVIGGDLSELPPDVEAAFLKNIFAFQQTLGSNETVTMLEALGSPTLPPADSLDEHALEAAWETLDELLDETGFSVDFLAEYPTEVKYRFVTEELVKKPVMWPMPEGMTMHTIYEEYHPNHKWDIENRSRGLVQAIFENNAEGMRQMLADDLTDGKEHRIPADECVEMLEDYLVRLGEVLDWNLEIVDSQFDLTEREVTPEADEEGDENSQNEVQEEAETYVEVTGLGYCEGRLKIVTLQPDGEERIIEGTFKANLQMDAGWWGIFHFALPGWKWS
jgi:hypothetical protein